MAAQVDIQRVQQQLVWIWGAGFLAGLSLMIAMTAAGTFGGHESEAWAWFLPTVLPTLGVAISTVVTNARMTPGRKVMLSFSATLVRVVSVFYVGRVLITVLAWPMTQKGPLAWFKISGLWLGPIQGFVTSVLTLFWRPKER
jgi:hypothetical protein